MKRPARIGRPSPEILAARFIKNQYLADQPPLHASLSVCCMEHSLHRLTTAPDAALLQDMALATGTSLDLAANCDAFLEALLAHLPLPYASVWLQSRYLGREHPPDGYTLAQARPTFRAHPPYLPVTHPLLFGLGDTACSTLSMQEAGLEGLPQNTSGGFVLFRLGEVGFLLLFDSAYRQPYPPHLHPALARVLTRFTASLEQCLAHRYLLNELTERDHTLSQLRSAINRLSAVLGGLSPGVLVEDEGNCVVLVNPAYCELFGLPDAPEALLGWDRRTLLDHLHPYLADPTTTTAAINRFVQGDQGQGHVTITLANDRTLEVSYTRLVLDNFRGHLWQCREVGMIDKPSKSIESRRIGSATLAGTAGPIVFQPAAVVEQVAAQLHPAAELKALRLQVSLSPLLPEALTGDAAGLSRVLMHLVEHAIRHTREGRVTLAATPIRRSATATLLQFAVIDTGTGLPQDRLTALLDESPEDNPGTVRAWAEAQGGRISAQSLRGRGTVITLVLPFANHTGAAAQGDGAAHRLMIAAAANPQAAPQPEP